MFRARRRQQIIKKQLKFYVIDGYNVARDAGMGNRINTIMQTCFFAISGVLAARRSHRANQEVHPEDLRQARRRGCAAELRGSGRGPSPSAPGTGAGYGYGELRNSACDSSQGSSICPRRARHDRGRSRRRSSGQRSACRWNVPDRNCAMGEAQHLAHHSGVGQGSLHPVRQVRHGLPACSHSRQGIRRVAGCRCARQPSRLRRRSGAAWNRISTTCRSLRKTAPAANCASKSAP